jgi:hypothetical protein
VRPPVFGASAPNTASAPQQSRAGFFAAFGRAAAELRRPLLGERRGSSTRRYSIL